METKNIFSSNNDIELLYNTILNCFTQVSQILRFETKNKEVGSKNLFGDIQLDSDITSEKIFFDELRKTNLVSYAISEETPSV